MDRELEPPTIIVRVEIGSVMFSYILQVIERFIHVIRMSHGDCVGKTLVKNRGRNKTRGVLTTEYVSSIIPGIDIDDPANWLRIHTAVALHAEGTASHNFYKANGNGRHGVRRMRWPGPGNARAVCLHRGRLRRGRVPPRPPAADRPRACSGLSARVSHTACS